MTWTGSDGSTWPLTSWSTGIFMVSGGTRGLTMPPLSFYRDESPAVAGARYRGQVTGAREVFWPIHVFHDGSADEWADRDAAFWRSLNPRREGTWTVSVPGRSVRTLRLRFNDDGDHAAERDPLVFGWQTYGITFQADQPYWCGEEIVTTWETGTGSDFFGGSEGAPPFIISSGFTLDAITINNPGDVDAYGVWTLNGPLLGGTVLVVDGHEIHVPFDIPSGQSLTIDTSPTAYTVVDSLGVDRFPELGEIDFTPIAPGTVQARVETTSTEGSVSLRLVPLYYRAW